MRVISVIVMMKGIGDEDDDYDKQDGSRCAFHHVYHTHHIHHSLDDETLDDERRLFV